MHLKERITNLLKDRKQQERMGRLGVPVVAFSGEVCVCAFLHCSFPFKPRLYPWGHWSHIDAQLHKPTQWTTWEFQVLTCTERQPFWMSEFACYDKRLLLGTTEHWIRQYIRLHLTCIKPNNTVELTCQSWGCPVLYYLCYSYLDLNSQNGHNIVLKNIIMRNKSSTYKEHVYCYNKSSEIQRHFLIDFYEIWLVFVISAGY